MSKPEENTKLKTEPQFYPVDNGYQIQKDTFSEDLANEMFLEAQELMRNSHWLPDITETGNTNEYDFLNASSKNKDVDSITDLQFSSGELSDDLNAIHGMYSNESSAQTSVIQRHGLSSIRERNHNN